MSRSKKDEESTPTLSAERLAEYALFRHNLRLLRATTGLSAEQLGKDLGLPKYHRIIDLEYGRTGVPKLEEVKRITEYFKVTIDELLYKKAVITFEMIK